MMTSTRTRDSKVVRVERNKVTSTCEQGKEHCYTLMQDAKVTCDGKDSKIADLKAGTKIRVTTKENDESTASLVESGEHVIVAAN